MKKNHINLGHKAYFVLSIITGIYLLGALYYISNRGQCTSLRIMIWSLIICNIFFVFCIMKYTNANMKLLWGVDGKSITRLDLLKKSERDGLTDLYNRQTAEGLTTAYLNSDLSIGTLNAFFILDIDYFKKVNDGFGHIIGDDVLKKIAKDLENIFRSNDIKSRLGGDEFTVFMKNVNDKTVAIDRAQAMLNRMCNYILETGESIPVTISIGIAYTGENAKNFKTLYQNADVALYSAKKSGRNQFKVYDGLARQ